MHKSCEDREDNLNKNINPSVKLIHNNNKLQTSKF